MMIDVGLVLKDLSRAACFQPHYSLPIYSYVTNSHVIWSAYVKVVTRKLNRTREFCKMDKIAERAIINICIKRD